MYNTVRMVSINIVEKAYPDSTYSYLKKIYSHKSAPLIATFQFTYSRPANNKNNSTAYSLHSCAFNFINVTIIPFHF